MDNIKEIERLISEYTKYYKIQLIEYEKIKNKKAAYEDLLELLSCEYNEILKNESLILILLDAIYGKDIDLKKVKEILSQENQTINFEIVVYKDYELLLKNYKEFTKKIEREYTNEKNYNI